MTEQLNNNNNNIKTYNPILWGFLLSEMAYILSMRACVCEM